LIDENALATRRALGERGDLVGENDRPLVDEQFLKAEGHEQRR